LGGFFGGGSSGGGVGGELGGIHHASGCRLAGRRARRRVGEGGGVAGERRRMGGYNFVCSVGLIRPEQDRGSSYVLGSKRYLRPRLSVSRPPLELIWANVG